MFKWHIFKLKSLYSISLILISLNFTILPSKVVANEQQEPFEIWESESLISIQSTEIEDDENNQQETEDVSQNVDGITSGSFDFNLADATGLYDETYSGLNTDIWSNSDFQEIKNLFAALPQSLSGSVLREFLDISLLTISAPPRDVQEENSFLNIKINYLINRGKYGEVNELYELLDSKEYVNSFQNHILNYYLIKSDYKSLCNSKKLKDIYLKKELFYKSFCDAMSSNLLALDLDLSLLREEGFAEDDYYYIYNSILNGIEININEIKSLDLFKLNLLQNNNVNLENIIKDQSDLNFKLFYSQLDSKINNHKTSLIEDLVTLQLLDKKYLSEAYSELSKNLSDTNELNNLQKRAQLYEKIRKTSNQDELVTLSDEFVRLYSERGILLQSSQLIYDKFKIIQPKQNYINQSSDICLLLILNDDTDGCKNWLNSINFADDPDDNKAKITFYLLLKNDLSAIDEEIIFSLLNNDDLSDNQKNIIAKSFEEYTGQKIISYWKSQNESSKVSTVIPNIKLIEYTKNLSEKNIGELIIMLNLIQGSNSTNDISEISSFLIIEKLKMIDEKFSNLYLLEYFTLQPL